MVGEKDQIRFLSPFDKNYPAIYSVESVRDDIIVVTDVGDFESKFVELVKAADPSDANQPVDPVQEPLEPTAEMIDAGLSTLETFKLGKDNTETLVVAIFKSMQQAAK